MVDGTGGHPQDEHSGADEAAEPVLDRPLPEGVRHRVVTIAADSFGGLTLAELPSALRPYARFTPSRRAKFAATALATALETDPAFRQKIAARLREAQPDLAEALEAGTPPPAADPLDVAVAAYLLRPAGWAKLVATAGEEAQRAQAARADGETSRELQQLRDELAEFQAQARDEAARGRAELDVARKENDATQRRLRSAISDMKRAEAALRRVETELEDIRAAAAADKATADSEARRLRTRVTEAEAAVEASRRSVREGRSAEGVRLRLLLDTVLDAATGLRRELALPPRDTMGVRPADTVEAVAPGMINPKDIAQRALSENDPALLDQLLALPQAHLVIDGYNVTKTGYPSLPLEKQRLRLLGGLAVLAAQSGAEVTCVFDGADLDAPVLLAPPRGVRVMFSKAGESADELIRRLVRAEPPGRVVVVVSADREVADGVAKAGARPVASTLLLKRLARG
ncbi:NYN domain-containing protein [Streptomyces sp. H10-C2]|uniref:NYN domain-containing protein n=1 Tax=unclassified Streptomyces TaxID=2593676 RepID=UPI0024B96E3E|nr:MULTISPECIES: NYN domain-containing protein [unclassified Streptomyces]MDJ0341140.1 NYN domain-containing protein [Streptomyces sp. PH10-H1]MDJ0369508.1 NYN domain-containing protein [Streptomyces sp. H10-C2]